MGFLTRIALSTAVTIGLLSATSFLSVASAGGAHGEYQRGVTCKQMRLAGTVKWHSIASGTVNTGGGRNGYSGFVTKACHTNEASCRRWLVRIGHEIANLDMLESAYCKRVR